MNYIYHCPIDNEQRMTKQYVNYAISLTSYKGVYHLEKLSDEEKKELLANGDKKI